VEQRTTYRVQVDVDADAGEYFGWGLIVWCVVYGVLCCMVYGVRFVVWCNAVQCGAVRCGWVWCGVEGRVWMAAVDVCGMKLKVWDFLSFPSAWTWALATIHTRGQVWEFGAGLDDGSSSGGGGGGGDDD